MKTTYRTIWVSDVHLLSDESKPRVLVDFLSSLKFDNLYLVGDIMDCWYLRRGWRDWHWDKDCNDLVRKVLKRSKKSKVTYLVGNHDDMLAKLEANDVGGIRLARMAIHLTVDGRLLMVTHGHEFDPLMKKGMLRLSRAADTGYYWVRNIFKAARRIGLPIPARLPSEGRLSVKRLTCDIEKFEERAAKEASDHSMDGIVCGHTHYPNIRQFGATSYYNCGDWTNSCTALAEDEAGRIMLLKYKEKPRLHGGIDGTRTRFLFRDREASRLLRLRPH